MENDILLNILLAGIRGVTNLASIAVMASIPLFLIAMIIMLAW